MSDTRYDWAHRYLLCGTWLPWEDQSYYRSMTVDDMCNRLSRYYVDELFFCGRSFYAPTSNGGLHEWRQM